MTLNDLLTIIKYMIIAKLNSLALCNERIGHHVIVQQVEWSSLELVVVGSSPICVG